MGGKLQGEPLLGSHSVEITRNKSRWSRSRRGGERGGLERFLGLRQRKWVSNWGVWERNERLVWGPRKQQSETFPWFLVQGNCDRNSIFKARNCERTHSVQKTYVSTLQVLLYWADRVCGCLNALGWLWKGWGSLALYLWCTTCPQWWWAWVCPGRIPHTIRPGFCLRRFGFSDSQIRIKEFRTPAPQSDEEH